MTDQFDIQRKLDGAGEAMVDSAMGLVEESVEKARERFARLIRLDDSHFFDPLDKIILLKVGKNFRNLGHDKVYLEIAAEKIEEKARADGFTALANGLFWNPTTKHLYVKNTDRYVLYTLDRRNTAATEW